MGTVFLFLVILIGCMNVMSNLIHKFFPEPHQNPDAPVQKRQQKDSSSNNSCNCSS